MDDIKDDNMNKNENDDAIVILSSDEEEGNKHEHHENGQQMSSSSSLISESCPSMMMVQQQQKEKEGPKKSEPSSSDSNTGTTAAATSATSAGASSTVATASGQGAPRGKRQALRHEHLSPQRKRSKRGGFLTLAKKEDLADAKAMDISPDAWNRDTWGSESDSSGSTEEEDDDVEKSEDKTANVPEASMANSSTLVTTQLCSNSSAGVKETPKSSSTTVVGKQPNNSNNKRKTFMTSSISKNLSLSAKRALQPYLISRGQSALRNSVLPFITRVLGMPLPWVLNPQFQQVKSMNASVFDYLAHPVQVFSELPGRRCHFPSTELYVAQQLTLLFEEARAMLSAGIEWWKRKLHEPIMYVPNLYSLENLCNGYDCNRVKALETGFSNGGFKTVSFELRSSSRRRNYTEQDDFRSRPEQNDVVLGFHASGEYQASFLALIQLPQNSEESPFSQSLQKRQDMSPRLILSPVPSLPTYDNKQCEEWMRASSSSIDAIKEGQEYYLLKLTNLTTSLREYSAIRTAPKSLFYPLLTLHRDVIKCEYKTNVGKTTNQVYLPRIAKKPKNMSYSLYERLRKNFNDSQIAAMYFCVQGGVKIFPHQNSVKASAATSIVAGATLQSSLQRNVPDSQSAISTEWGSHGVREKPINEAYKFVKNNGIEVVLVQGPPGTGKTSTLLAIISAVLACPPESQSRQSVKKEHSSVCPGSQAAKDNNSSTVYASKTILAPLSSRTMERVPDSACLLSERPRRKTPLSSAQQTSSSQPPQTLNNKTSSQPSEEQPSKRHLGRILVCAPSNAAVDEILRRLVASKGPGPLWSSAGERFQPRVVRLGPTSAIEPSVQGYSLDAQVCAANERNSYSVLTDEQFRELEQEISKIDKELATFTPCGSGNTNATVEHQRRKLEQKRKRLLKQRHESKVGLCQKKEENANIRQNILNSAHIITTTLACSNGYDIQSLGGRGFDCILVDEACQSVEPTALIPLAFNCPKLILIGDPKQLPATTLCRHAESTGYNRSLFERLAESGVPVCMLTEQFRMLPQIRAFPGKHFYEGALSDGRSILERPPMPFHQDFCFSGITWIDVSCSEELMRSLPRRVCQSLPRGMLQSLCIQDNSSFSNPLEAELVVALYEHLLRTSIDKKVDMRGRVGVITPYRGQISAIKNTLNQVMGQDASKGAVVNTVDGFQGQEKEVIIISCVRGSKHAKAKVQASDSEDIHEDPLQYEVTRKNEIGFLKDARRMNVAVTRAKSSVVIVGDSQCLSEHSGDWKALIRHCQEQNKFWELVSTSRQPGGCESLVQLLNEKRYRVASSLLHAGM